VYLYLGVPIDKGLVVGSDSVTDLVRYSYLHHTSLPSEGRYFSVISGLERPGAAPESVLAMPVTGWWLRTVSNLSGYTEPLCSLTNRQLRAGW
jgi:hypothetical protein